MTNNVPEVNKEVLTLVLQKPVLNIQVNEWFDKVNGNSYWSARATVGQHIVAVLPFQYGYESHGMYKTVETIYEAFTDRTDDCKTTRSRLEEMGFVMEYDKIEDCTESSVRRWGKWPS